MTALTGSHHGQSKDSYELGLEIVNYMRQRVDEFAEEYDLNYTLLATPAEGLSGRFVRIDRKLFGTIPGVTDKDYYTNSFHVPVAHDISTAQKITIEGAFHRYANAGHISYVELDAPPLHNPEAVETIIRQMAESDMGYAGINFPVDECRFCGASGLFDDNCPHCGSDDIRRVRRITGYLSTIDRFNEAKVAELKDRKAHLKIFQPKS